MVNPLEEAFQKNFSKFRDADQKTTSWQENNPIAHAELITRIASTFMKEPGKSDTFSKEREDFLSSQEIAGRVIQSLYDNTKEFLPPLDSDGYVLFGAMHGWTLAILFLRDNPEYIEQWIDPFKEVSGEEVN